MSQSLSEKITTETLRKIASNEEYDENEILCVAEYLCNLYDYDFDNQFGLINTDEPSEHFIINKLKDLKKFDKNPFFIVYSKGIKHWICFAITYLHNSVVVLYKDSYGVTIPNDLREAICDALKEQNIKFECHRGTEQSDENCSGPICLRNLQVFMKGLKSEIIRVPLIEKFQKVRFCSQYGVLSVKREFRLWLQKYLLTGLEQVANELVNDDDYENFRNCLNTFLDNCTKIMKEAYLLSSTYTGLLKTEAKKKDQDYKYESDHKTVKALKDARDHFYRNNEILRSLKFNKDDFIDLDDGNRVYNLEIQEKFPEQMQKFTKIFAVLAQAEMDDDLERALRKVSEMLKLEYGKIRVFFEQHKPPRRPEFMRDFGPPNVIGNLEKAVEALKTKSKAKDSIKEDTVDKKIKNWDLLLSELKLDIEVSKDDLSSKPSEIESQVKEIRECFPIIQQHYEQWSSRGIPEISMYANACKAEEKLFTTNQLCEAIAILDRANELATGGLRLRAPQILSVLVFLKSTYQISCRGKLCQIESGEGKTVIVSLLATIAILQGEKAVDVITSNAVLAQEGVDSRKLFYTMFNISVATNAADKTYASGPRKCYLADVVYGSISDFQFDYLRDTAEGLGTLSGRQFGRVILDEVDNMLVDNGRHIAKISSPFPGMENLKYIYLKIWSELLTVENQLVEDFQEKLKEFSDLKNTKDMAITEFVKIFDSSMLGRMEERIKANLQDMDFKFVPTHCLKYAQGMIPKWISNAIRARYFIRENEDYCIKESNNELAIIPVDYSNTGVTLKNTVWSYGLHQFVQIKHNLRITPESLTSSCVSNYAYIGKYGNKIFGLTGTLGSKAEQELLSSIYNVDYARVPTYKTKVFKEQKGIVVPDEEWSYEVALMTIGLIRSTGRAVLIICKTIADLMLLEEQFASMKSLPWDCTIQIKKFQDEDTADVTREMVAVGDVIVATNIAGRGADFKTSRELESNGGLHVCVGFCPDNERVREQAFFRTSRQGNFGSAQLVVRESEIRKLKIDTTDLDKVDFDEVKRRIDIIEMERLRDIKFSKVDVLRYEDALFTLFSDLCQELKNGNVITWGHSYLMKDLKEYWAFWLEDQNFEGKKYTLKEASFIFYKFKNHETTRRIIGGSISQNPYYGVLQADFFLKNDEVEKAKNSLVNAICLSKNPNVMFPAFFTLFDATLEEKGPLLPKFKAFLSKVFTNKPIPEDKSASFTSELLEFLKIAHNGLTEEIEYMERYYFNDDYNYDFKSVLVKPVKGKQNIMVKHLAAKCTCLKSYRANIDVLLESLDGSDTHHLAISKRITDYLKNFVPDTKEGKQTKDLMTEAELSELGAKGLKTIYGVKKIALVSDSTVEKARNHILGALTLNARATAFPPLTFAVGNVVSVMVAEAIALMVLTLFKETNNIDDMVQKSEYLKGKTLNYIVSLMVSGTLNLDVCIKIFLRMVRCYRESYYLLEHSTDNVRLLKSVNSTQIIKDVETVEKSGEYGLYTWTKRVYVPESLAPNLFESDVGNTIIGSLVEFTVEKDSSNGLENGNNVQDKSKTTNGNAKKISFFNSAPDDFSVPKIELYLLSVAPNKYGGSYEELQQQFPKSDTFLKINLIPLDVCYDNTPFSSIPKSKMPAMMVLQRDYRGLYKLRFSAGCEDVNRKNQTNGVVEINNIKNGNVIKKEKADDENKKEKKASDGKKGKKSVGEKKKEKKIERVIATYRSKQKELLEKCEFWLVLKNEISEILAVSKFYELNAREFANYNTPIVQMLHYCRDNSIDGAPEMKNVPKGHLINHDQYNVIMQHFRLKPDV